MLLQDWGTGARLGTQGKVALGLASLGLEFSEEVAEPVTGYRVDMLLHCSGDGATGRCAVEVGVDIIIGFVVVQPALLVSLSFSQLTTS